MAIGNNIILSQRISLHEATSSPQEEYGVCHDKQLTWFGQDLFSCKAAVAYQALPA